MPKYKTQPINDDYKIEVNTYSHPVAYSEQVLTQIEEIWQQEMLNKKGNLFNGKLLSMIQFNGHRLLAEYVDYKIFLAQLREKSLKQDLEVTPVCISGITICNDHILLGRRGEFVTQEPGKWECPPSGGVDAMAYQEGKIVLSKLILHELQEETHIESTLVENLELFALVHDLEKDVIDLAVKIELLPDALSHVSLSTKEYPHLQWIPMKELKIFAAEYKDECVPLSLHLLKLQKLI